MSNDIYVNYDEIEHQTDEAILFVINSEQIWLPKSQIKDHDENSKVVIIPKWIADKNDLSSDW